MFTPGLTPTRGERCAGAVSWVTTGVLAALLALAAPATAKAPRQDSPALDWIRPEDVPTRADQLRRRLEAGLPDADDKAWLAEIERSLPVLVRQLDAVVDRANNAVHRRPTPAEIEDIQYELADVASPLADWETQLHREAERVAKVLDDIARARGLWTRTAARPETAAAGSVVVQRTQISIEALRSAAEQLGAWRDRVIAVSDRVIDRAADADSASRLLQETELRIGQNLFIPEQPPLWARGFADTLRSELPQAPKVLRDYAASTAAYIGRDPRPFLLQVLLAALLMFALGRLCRRRRAPVDGDHPTASILDRPYSMGLLLVLVASPLFHPLAPRRMLQLAAIAALFPAARLILHVATWATPKLFLGFFLLLLLDRLDMALQPLPALETLAFLMTLATGLVLLRWLIRRQRDTPTRTRAAGAAAVLLAAAFLGEIGGWTYLASLFGRGTLAAMVVALFVYAAVISLAAVFSIVLGSALLQRSHLVDRNAAALQQRTERFLPWIGIPLWLYLVAGALGLRGNLLDALSTLLHTGVSVGALSLSVGGLLAFVLTLVAAFGLARLVTGVLEADVYPRTHLPRGVPYALSTLTRYGVYALGFLLALAAAGVQLSQVSIILGGFGVGIGLGLQDLVKNFAAGLTLLFERRVHVGDALELSSQGIVGRVISIDMRASVVRTWNGAEVVVPNADLISDAVTNWTLSDHLYRMEMAVGVAYGSDLDRVVEVLLDAVRSNEQLLNQPAPQALFTGFGDSSLDFLVRAWTDQGYDKAMPLISDLGLAIHRKLREAGIEVPFPQRDLHLKSVPSESGGATPAEEEGTS